jgi:phospholipase C
LKGTSDGYRVATYVVKAGDTLQPSFPSSLFADAGYAIEVHAPNGLYRSFKGNFGSPSLEIRTEYEKSGSHPTGNILVHVRNIGSRAVIVTVAESSYRTHREQRSLGPDHTWSPVLHLEKSHGWYDFSVAGGDVEAHFCGRVETGRPSISDPLIGPA